MLQLSHLIRKFNRFELKYIITLPEAECFKMALRAYLIPDPQGNEQGSYQVSSLYYDSPDFRCYWEKLDGLKFRRKLRIRYYGDWQEITEKTPVFVEIKQRLNRVTQKRRVVLRYSDALQLCNERRIVEGTNGQEPRPEYHPILNEIYGFLHQYNLHPARVVRYTRQALIGADYDLGLRVTFDTNLFYQAYPLSLVEQVSVLPLFPADIVVMEIKVNDRIPYWLTELVAAHNLQLVRVSKYCHSIDVTRDFSPAKWRIAVAG